MFKFIRAFRNAQQSLDARVDEWIALLKEDAPLYPRDRRPDTTLATLNTGGAHRKPSLYSSLTSRHG